MRLADFHVSGYAPLQHSGYVSGGFDLQYRASMRAVRVLDRFSDPGDVGHWKIDADSVGDVTGGQLWKTANKQIRALHTWRFAMPVSTTPSIGGGTPTGGGTAEPGSSCSFVGRNPSLLPLLDDLYTVDDRFKPYIPGIHPTWPKFPKGTVGISLAGQNEDKQIDLFHPTDPRLYSIHRAGDPGMGSLVYDLQADTAVDPSRGAPLQSIFRVIKKPFGRSNSIAHHIAPSGCGDSEGGYVWDRSEQVLGHIFFSAPSPPAIGMLSRRKNGPYDVGSGKCRHIVGQDADGTPIGPMHIAHNFLLRASDLMDGPLRITLGTATGFDPIAYPQPTKVIMIFDEKTLDWTWIGSCAILYSGGTTTPPPTEPEPEPTPSEPPPISDFPDTPTESAFNPST